MGILGDIARGKLDFVHGDVEKLADPRNWSKPKRLDNHSKLIKEEKKTTEETEDVEINSSDDEEK